MDNKITIICKTETGNEIKIRIKPDETIQKLIDKIMKEIKDCKYLELYFNNILLNPSLIISKTGLKNNSHIYIKNEIRSIEEGLTLKEINIQFFYDKTKNIPTFNSNVNLTSLLKLCLLKEISHVIESEQLINLTSEIRVIIEILKNGYVDPSIEMKNDIKKVMEKIYGSNIINFSRFVDNNINSEQLQSIMNLLQKGDYIKINDVKNRLAKYEPNIELFDKNFKLALQNSIFEFSVISLVVIDREDYQIYQQEKGKCPNVVEEMLYHGTTTDAVAAILTTEFWKSEKKHYQHGKGVYFTDKIDYCYFYGGDKSNRINTNIIPKVDDCFNMIACSIYYDRKHRIYVENEKYTPKKYEMNYAFAGADLRTIKETDLNKTKFYGTEYVIYELCQICPFLGIKLRRTEYCFIWRDTNFSKKQIYSKEWDTKFKKFLAERMKYIEEYAEFNVYPCETTEKALKLVERKKYNKIILISNIGPDEGGKAFVEKARKIIGKDVIALFLAYNITKHLKNINNYKNALISNDEKIYEKYLQCFSGYGAREKILELKENLEDNYNVQFIFDEDFLNFPLYRGHGYYSELKFDEL